jgi:hypothetical protein
MMFCTPQRPAWRLTLFLDFYTNQKPSCGPRASHNEVLSMMMTINSRGMLHYRLDERPGLVKRIRDLHLESLIESS